MPDSLPVHLDRCLAALASHGVRLRRSKALELMAALLGHRSSNELAAAARRGELDPPAAVAHPATAEDGRGPPVMTPLLDPVSGGWFGVDPGMLADGDRASGFIMSPWGNLLDVRPLRGKSTPPRFSVPASAPVDLHALLREAEATGAESLDLVSDGTVGRVVARHPGKPDLVLHEGTGSTVDAIVHRVRQDQEEGYPVGPVTYLGRELRVDDREVVGPDHLRLHLEAGRDRRTRVMRHVYLSSLDASLVETATFWSDDGADVEVLRLVGEGLGKIQGRAPARVGAEPDDMVMTSVMLDLGTDDVARKVAERLGMGVDEVVASALAGHDVGRTQRRAEDGHGTRRWRRLERQAAAGAFPGLQGAPDHS